MTWGDIGALSEFIAALAVVVSLVYVSRQIRQNTSAIKAANATTVQKNFVDLANTLYSDRELAGIILKGMSGTASLTPPEQLAAYAWFFNMLKTAELAHFHLRNGDLDEDLWEASLQFYRAYFTTPGMKAYWQHRRSAFIPEFQEAMDGWLAAESHVERPDTLVQRTASQGK